MAQKHRKCAVVAVAYDESMDSPLVMLRQDGEEGIIGIPVGAYEAGSIIMAAKGLRPIQPQTHDVLAELLTRHGFRMEGFEIWGNSISGYYGRLHYRRGFLRHTMDVRPSDGIALALRLHKPIRVDQSLVEGSFAAERPSSVQFQADHILLLHDLKQNSSVLG